MDLLVFLYLLNFLKTLLIIAAIYYGVRVITKYVLPFLVAKGVKNMQEKMQDQYQQQNRKPQRPQGEVTIEKKPANARNSEKDTGEYIDFEEVD